MNEECIGLVWNLCMSTPVELLQIVADELADSPEGSSEDLQKRLGLTSDVTKRLEAVLKHLSPREASLAIRTGAYFCQKEESRRSSFVWSGPSYAIKARKTEQVILDLIEKAEKELLLVSFAAYKIPLLLKALQRAINRGVKTRFVLETEVDSKGKLNNNAMIAFSSLKGARFYHWPQDKRERYAPGKNPVMHAKCVVTEKAFLITSANLTEHAISFNMELGILSFNEEKANILMNQFMTLTAKGELKEMVSI